MGGGEDEFNLVLPPINQEDLLIRLQGTNNGIIDIAGNEWTSNGEISSSNNGIYFGGTTTTYLKMSDASKSLGSGDFTVTCWIKPEEAVSPYPAVFILYNNLCFFEIGTNLHIGPRLSENRIVYDAYEINKRKYVTIIRYQGVINVYINGKLKGTFDNFVGNNQTLGNLFLGICDDSPHNSFFKGWIQDLIVTTTALWTSNF